MIKRGAIIDMGTNTWNLVIGEQKPEGEAYIHRSKAVVKLAKGGIDSNEINTEAQERAIAAIKQHLKVLAEYEVPVANVKAIGTSGMRSLKNGYELGNQIEKEFDIRVQIIDGNEEANLIRKGVSKAVELPDDSFYLIMDIGGGSTEFIIGKGAKVMWKQSTDLGVSRLLEQFKPDDPMPPVALNQLQYFIDAKLLELREQLSLYPVNTLIGSSGSFETFYSIQECEQRNEIQQAPYYELQVSKQYDLFTRLIHSSMQERLDWPGLIEMRAETMNIAALLVETVSNYANPNQMLVSEYALKEGAISAWLNQIQ